MVQKEKHTGRRQENVTIKTIAEEAGVTLTTVSRILNQKDDKYKYAEETKERVFRIANRLKYRPNALVRGMQTGRTGTAGVMVPVEGFYTQVVAGIHDVFLNNDTIMLLSWNNRSLNDREEKLERQIIHQMVDRRVQGIILRPSSEDFERSYFEEIWERNIPLILIDRHMSRVETDFVGTDDLAGGRVAAEYLIGLGHRRLLFAGAGTSLSTSRNREAGFREVLSETTQASGMSIVARQETIRDDLLRHVRGNNPCTAVFCYNDDLASTVIKILGDAGLSVPGDVSVIGFGNVALLESRIPITTFDQKPFQIGQAAAEIYLERTNQPDQGGVHNRIITPELVVRESAAPPRIA